MKNIKIGSKTIGPNHPCYIIAEASSNHGGSLRRAKKMIRVAADSGADAVKFQLFKAEEIAADTNKVKVNNKTFVKSKTKLTDLYKANELPRIWIPKLVDYAKKQEIEFLATPFDEEAVKLLQIAKVRAYKIASYEMLDVPLLRAVAKTKKPIILSTGMANLKEVEQAIDVIKKGGNSKIVLLHCRSTYPLPVDQVNLKSMEVMRERFKLQVGYSDHSLGINVPVTAVAMGARVIEKHFYLNDGVKTVDNKFSLKPTELKKMCARIRETETVMGKNKKIPTKPERRERKYRRSLWVVSDIQKGEKFTNRNIKSLRPGLGLSPLEIDKVIGKKAIYNIRANTALTNKLLKQKVVVFRVDTSSKAGMGHLMRCYCLAQAWKKKGAKVSYKKGGKVKNDVKHLIKHCLRQKADWVVVDGYCFDDNYQKQIKKAGLNLLVFDDIGKLKHYWADIVLNQNAHATKIMYKNCEKSTKLLLGTEYALIRDEFDKYRTGAGIRKQVKKIIISFGGSDVQNQSQRLKKLVDNLKIENLKVEVLKGRNIERRLAGADLAITSGGITVWELAYLGVPTLIAETSKVESALARGVKKYQAFGYLGKVKSKSNKWIKSQVKKCMDNFVNRYQMSQNAQKIIDGRGAERIIKEMRLK